MANLNPAAYTNGINLTNGIVGVQNAPRGLAHMHLAMGQTPHTLNPAMPQYGLGIPMLANMPAINNPRLQGQRQMALAQNPSPPISFFQVNFESGVTSIQLTMSSIKENLSHPILINNGFAAPVSTVEAKASMIYNYEDGSRVAEGVVTLNDLITTVITSNKGPLQALSALANPEQKPQNIINQSNDTPLTPGPSPSEIPAKTPKEKVENTTTDNNTQQSTTNDVSVPSPSTSNAIAKQESPSVKPKSPVLSDIVEFLLDNGSDVNAADEAYWTPLHIAVSTGNLAVTEKLLQLGATVNAQNEMGLTPLHLACEEGYGDCALVLIENGGDITLENEQKKTPLDLCKKQMRDFILQQTSTEE
ncbi:11220_t:CDS:2 [Racocetra fulgida]|uniref:11220_t:CDS:1 n=1 Tax=Racocetra fulgida TaxID=60492 RepID=A0A9N9BNA0_9GLOM|nr:11220_t:CDS:2 [Racocetra fulgida]